jgi:hypothetical protein
MVVLTATVFAALILARCISENAPEPVAQSLPGSAPQKGQRKDSGLMGGRFGAASPGIVRAYALPKGGGKFHKRSILDE